MTLAQPATTSPLTTGIATDVASHLPERRRSRSAQVPLEDLRTRLSGELVLPGERAYEPGRHVWNAAVDRHPAAMLYAANAADVARGVTFARDHALPIAVRSGGHSMAGHGVVDD
ncbi:MAG TPA: hypothetical protein VEY67_12025, partial [Candidatus Dormibacteraeota bacterium]|nr:hypothetical protein [Candidatus Dormibacteraeota bacterium]